MGALDNAWFDSPVMSRHHAELSLNVDDNVRTPNPAFQKHYVLTSSQTVEIMDVGSMHGTFLNSDGLTQYEPAVINDNDIVVFGTRVTRGSESIPACAFRITLKHSPYK